MKKNNNVRKVSKITPISNEEQQLVNVIVETPKGGRIKFKYDEQLNVFEMSRLLPKGMVFPYDFGFFPKTKADDGDPLDVLLLMDEPAFPGCLVKARIVGVLEAEQTEEGDTHRNDRILAVAETSIDFAEVKHIEDLPKTSLEQIEEFFITYNRQFGKEIRFLDRKGPSVAWSRLNRSMGMRKAA
jgi:inorganic pyrophosphatase